MSIKIHNSSFRDPSGFLFYDGERLLRQVNESYREDFDHLVGSGLLNHLFEKGMLVVHKEVSDHPGVSESAYKVIEPEKVKFISYPYEWCFTQMKDAALLTLQLQKKALKFGMTLKDATAYNIQFSKGRPVLIDTLSFERYTEGQPWQAYRQFCQHFLAPLALMSFTDIRLIQLMKVYMDGIPLDLAARLLPFKTRLNVSLLIHLHLHAKAQKKYENQGQASGNVRIPKNSLLAMIEGLISTVQKLRINTKNTEWGDYYSFTNYSPESFGDKKRIVSEYLSEIRPKVLWDLGANTGEFTKLASDLGTDCIAFDIDPLAVESLYLNVRKQKTDNLLPLILDLTNPSPAIGWNNTERMAIKSRPLPDTVLALALIHHLAISNNLPFTNIAAFLKDLGKNLIIEFVPKSDSQVKKLFSSRKDVFPGYDVDNFARKFEEFYTIISMNKVPGSERIIFRMERR